LPELARYFLWLGTTGFGGPVALCALMERDLVERRAWLARSDMRDLIAVCQTMPGPLAVQVAIFIGYVRRGTWGALVAGCALILPASAMVAALAWAYVTFRGLPWLSAVTYGVSPAVIALILHSWWRLARLGMEDRFQFVIACAAMLATFALPAAMTATFIAAGLLGIGWYALRGRANDPTLREAGSVLLLVKMAWFFLVTGAFTLGAALPSCRCWKKDWFRAGSG